jgi:hypothetical protein
MFCFLHFLFRLNIGFRYHCGLFGFGILGAGIRKWSCMASGHLLLDKCSFLNTLFFLLRAVGSVHIIMLIMIPWPVPGLKKASAV